jgi:hypothetical protein
VFVPGKPLNGKALGLAHVDLALLEKLAIEKWSSLFCVFVCDEEKKFYKSD